MANSFLTSKEIARQALPILENNLVMAGLVYRSLDSTFAKKGDTIQVRKPTSFTANEFDGDLTGEFQDITETSVEVQLSKISSVDVEVTSKELTLEVSDFNKQIVEPAMAALAQKIDYDLTELYKDIPYYYGTSGATPDELQDISQTRKILNENKVPMKDRRLVIDPEADASFNVLDVFAKVDASGSTEGLKEASLGRKLGMDLYMDQNIRTHTAGTFTAVTTPLTNGSIAADATTLTIDGGAGTETLLVGDLITIGSENFTVTANATASSGAISVSVYPAVETTITDGTAVVFPDKTATAHTANVAFHQNAFALVSRPLLPPSGGADSYSTSIGNGINVRVVMGYDIKTKTNMMSFDVLYGVKTLYPELAARLLG